MQRVVPCMLCHGIMELCARAPMLTQVEAGCPELNVGVAQGLANVLINMSEPPPWPMLWLCCGAGPGRPAGQRRDAGGGGLPGAGRGRAQHLRANTTVKGIEAADAILLIGTNPRIEAPVFNARCAGRGRSDGVEGISRRRLFAVMAVMVR